MKFGLDIHGVIDKHPEVFAVLAKALVDAGQEVHILTGPLRTKAEKDLLALGLEFGIHYTHFCSITEYRMAQGYPVKFDEVGDPWMPPEIWDTAKAEYCLEQGIDLCIDDSPVYGQHFKTLYLQKIYQTQQVSPFRQKLNKQFGGAQ